jgi:hypothetical protein
VLLAGRDLGKIPVSLTAHAAAPVEALPYEGSGVSSSGKGVLELDQVSWDYRCGVAAVGRGERVVLRFKATDLCLQVRDPSSQHHDLAGVPGVDGSQVADQCLGHMKILHR